MDYRDPDWVAEKLGLDRNTVYKFLQDGVIPAVQLGRKWLISESRLDQWLKEETEKQTRARKEAASSTDHTVRRLNTFTAEARQVLKRAHSEARRYAHAYLGQEHLLLGFASNPDCAASRALRSVGVGLEAVRGRFEARLPPGTEPVPRRLGRTPQTKKAMRLAAKEAQRAGRKLVGSEHLLLGIFLAGEGAGYEMLNDMGLTLARIRQASEQSNTIQKGDSLNGAGD